ncbi:MAG: DUF1801 domain-containing protein [Cytophagaceae bacterium]
MKKRASSYRMQNVKFRSVDEFLDFLPEDELKMTLALRRLVFDCVPGVKEKLSFNVPFYTKNKGLFFIWPASVLWGKNKTYEGVRFGFQYGCLLADENNYLDKGDRKQVYWRDFMNPGQIDMDLLKAYIFEALLIDQSFKKR